MKRRVIHGAKGFTLAEICVAVAIVSVVGAAAYTMLMNSTTLLAKNVSLNSSNLLARSALDRIFAELNQANRMPSLIDVNGSAVSGDGPAAGIMVDRYIGGPYVVGNPGGGLPANATTFKLFYSADPLANPPVPVKNDVVIMDGTTRALVKSCAAPTSTLSSPIPSPSPTPGQMLTVTLQDSLGTYTSPPITAGTAIPWNSTTQQTAYIIHRKAFIVVPGADPKGPAELRMYPDAETVTNWNDPANYVVLTRSIGTKTVDGVAENTPFSYVTEKGLAPNPPTPLGSAPQFLKIAMRLEDQQFNKRLATQQANEFNTFFRVDTMLRPRNVAPL